ncbi:MAG TPA: phenylacetate-CoA oxygenase subunit PaaJ, partial [Arthrobacter sp.]|nr:phenylacetate-CoA oxygenase subunit PaaJ [Arthrobacter sp.]
MAEMDTKTAEQKAWDIAATVCDPEIPVLTVADLGILRNVQLFDD